LILHWLELAKHRLCWKCIGQYFPMED